MTLEGEAAAREEPARLVRVGVDGRVEEGVGPGPVASAVTQQVAEVPKGGGVLRVDVQRSLEGGDRVVIASFIAEDEAFVVERAGGPRRAAGRTVRGGGAGADVAEGGELGQLLSCTACRTGCCTGCRTRCAGQGRRGWMVTAPVLAHVGGQAQHLQEEGRDAA